ncbi:heme NO-binding domain-containing protein [Echinicola shivajiensis]|uniref:heme NO-binding domain-containing protein n=1 Tax=Echinicola shivajiensis TaxID=1035916 RepID=UPI001BFC1670|nr:heme NO-binding domain-containing protein [Echinicola shivajiensis]
MYGIVNQTIEDLLTKQYSEEVWKNAKEKIHLKENFFLINKIYSDEMTFKLIAAASEITGKTSDEILRELGKWWIIKVSQEKYGSLMSTGGKNLKEFLINLPAFHTRVMMLYPKIDSPEFEINIISENKLLIHYSSYRSGLQEFVYGILLGLAELFKTPMQIKKLPSRVSPEQTALFEVHW